MSVPESRSFQKWSFEFVENEVVNSLHIVKLVPHAAIISRNAPAAPTNKNTSNWFAFPGISDPVTWNHSRILKCLGVRHQARLDLLTPDLIELWYLSWEISVCLVTDSPNSPPLAHFSFTQWLNHTCMGTMSLLCINCTSSSYSVHTFPTPPIQPLPERKVRLPPYYCPSRWHKCVISLSLGG